MTSQTWKEEFDKEFWIFTFRFIQKEDGNDVFCIWDDKDIKDSSKLKSLLQGKSEDRRKILAK